MKGKTPIFGIISFVLIVAGLILSTTIANNFIPYQDLFFFQWISIMFGGFSLLREERKAFAITGIIISFVLFLITPAFGAFNIS